jgi:hypothetical protein
MQTKQLLALGALAMSILTIPATAIADPAALVGPSNHSALAQPNDLGPIVAPLSGCMTHLRYVSARGPGGGHYDWSATSCARYVSARGPGGGHYDASPSSCVRYVSARGPGGGHYVDTCPGQPRYVPAHGPGGGHYDYSSTASAIHGSTEPIAPGPASHAAAWGFDWGSAGIGAATVLGAFGIALAAITAMRRRRIATP